jgi:hypothetical protein
MVFECCGYVEFWENIKIVVSILLNSLSEQRLAVARWSVLLHALSFM